MKKNNQCSGTLSGKHCFEEEIEIVGSLQHTRTRIVGGRLFASHVPSNIREEKTGREFCKYCGIFKG